MIKRSLALALAVISLIAGIALRAADKNEGYVAAVSDGGGNVKLMWTIPDGAWPSGGYTLERIERNGKAVKIATGLRPDWDPGLTAKLDGSRVEPLKKLAAWDLKVASGENPGDFEGLKNYIFLFATMEFPLAQAMGIAWEDNPGRSGPASYRLSESDGKLVGTSLSVDPGQVTPLADPPTGLKAVASPQGVKLVWDSPAPTPGLPLFFFRVMRDTGAGFKVISKGPVLGGQEGEDGKEMPPSFVDPEPPVGQKVKYAVVGVDVFGRETFPSGTVSVDFPDFEASYPPRGFKAEEKPGKIILSWNPSGKNNTSGYVIERSNFKQGPFVAVTDKTLPVRLYEYEDTDLHTGQRYFYRIKALDRSGRVGVPSDSIMARARAGAPPEAPTGLEAILGVGRVVLRWNRVKGAQAYRVEQTGEDSDKWVPSETLPTPEPRFVWPIVTGQSGVVKFRVLALAGDGTKGKPSSSIKVNLPRNRPPSAPHFTDFDGKGGKVELNFVPTGDTKEVAGFFILRSNSLTAPREVLNLKPLAPDARSFTDSTAVAGSEYVYRVVAVDEALNRSEASAPITVYVGETLLTAPPVPTAIYTEGGLPKVTVTFKPPQGINMTFLQRKVPEEKSWMKVAGPVLPGSDTVVDMKPPASGQAEYRVYYQTPRGMPGPPSKAVTVNIEKKK